MFGVSIVQPCGIEAGWSVMVKYTVQPCGIKA